jgi:hypothetical protein
MSALGRPSTRVATRTDPPTHKRRRVHAHTATAAWLRFDTAWLMSLVLAAPRSRYLPRTLQTYFAQIQPIDASKAEDGVFLGNIVVDVAEAAKKPERASAVRTFVERTAALRESGVGCLDALLTASLGESGHDVLPQAVATTTPGALTVADATAIGRGFDAIIRVSATPSDAVDELLRKYAAVDVAAQQHGWARPMLETIAKRRAKKATLGLKLRLGIGAAFSFDAGLVLALLVRSEVSLANLGLFSVNELAATGMGEAVAGELLSHLVGGCVGQ